MSSRKKLITLATRMAYVKDRAESKAKQNIPNDWDLQEQAHLGWAISDLCEVYDLDSSEIFTTGERNYRTKMAP